VSVVALTRAGLEILVGVGYDHVTKAVILHFQLKKVIIVYRYLYLFITGNLVLLSKDFLKARFLLSESRNRHFARACAKD